MRRIPTWARRGPVAVLIMLSLLTPLLAACGAETSTSGLRGAATPHASATAATLAASATVGGQPYTFPKAWQTASGAPTNVTLMNGMAFASSQPLTGYACDNEPPAGTPTPGSAYAAAIYRTRDGGQSWASLNGALFTQMGGNCTVFVDPADANDVLVAGGALLSNQAKPGIWRSQDGGATWHQFAAPTVAGWPSILVQKITVLGARIVVAVSINGEGQLPNDLYSSDDGGASWQQFAASLPANVADFVTLGGAMIVETTPPGGAQSPAPGATAPTGRGAADHTLAATARRSSGGPAPVFYRSDDGGNTWSKVTIPGGLPVFTQSATGNNFYGVSIAPPQYQFTFATAYWTQDSGATWKALPTLEGVESNWIDPNSLGFGLMVGPDGSVFTDTQHFLGGNNGNVNSGVFMLRPTDSSPAWQPLAPDAPTAPSWLAAVPVNGNVRLVNVEFTSPSTYTGTPVYLDLP